MTQPSLPNKCEHCGLRVYHSFRSIGETTSSDKTFADLRTLHEKGIIKPVYSRVIGASNDPRDFGETEFCAVASKAWHKNAMPCSHWVLRIAGASVADYLSIYHNRRNYSLAQWAGISAILIAIAIAVLQAAL